MYILAVIIEKYIPTVRTGPLIIRLLAKTIEDIPLKYLFLMIFFAVSCFLL